MLKMQKIVSLLLVLLLMAALAGCGSDKTPQTEPTPAPVQQVDPQEAVTEPQEENLNVVTVNTSYGDLYYQEQWSEHMLVTQQLDGELLVVAFIAEFNGIQYPLFELMIGADKEESVAQLTDAEGTKRHVAVNFLELGEYPDLAEDEQNQLYAMQEDINYIVDNIK